MTTVLRYTEELQKFYHAKTKPEPWLHFVITSAGSMERWAIYVWDTRNVIEEGSDYRPVPQGVSKAVDNRKMLEGAKNLAITAVFDKRYFAVGADTIHEVFDNNKAADAWYEQYRAEHNDINMQLIKVIANADSEYAKLHPDYKPGRDVIPQELMKFEDDARSKFYAKQPERHRPGYRFVIKSAKWLAQNEPKLYKSTINHA